MRFSAYLAVAALSLPPAAVDAANISDSTAKEVKAQVERVLPKVFEQILQISPAGDHYLAQLDFDRAILNLDAPVHISEISPIDSVLKQRADGVWDISAEGKDAWLIGDHFFGRQPSHFQLHLGGYNADVALEPAKKIPANAKVSITDLDFSSRAYQDTLTFSATSYVIRANIGELKDGRIDFSTDLATKDVHEVRKLPELLEAFTVWDKSDSAHTSVKGVDIEGVRNLLLALGKDGMGDGKSTDIPWQQLATVLRDHPSLIESFKETGAGQTAGVSFRDINVVLESFGVELAARGTPKDNAVAFRLSAHHPSLQPGRFAAGIEAAVPEDASVGFEFSGMDMPGGIIAAADRGPSATESERKAAFLQAFLPNHRLRMEISNTFARSQYYDVTAAGWFEFNPRVKKDAELDITITARDLDKTVAFLQANANSVPQFGQASFMLLMAKGFGEQEKEGAMTWHVQAGPNRKLLINGREIRH